MKKLEEEEKSDEESDIEDESHPLNMELIESSTKDDELECKSAKRKSNDSILLEKR